MGTGTTITAKRPDYGNHSFLADTLVLDLTEGPAGFCAKLLADLGARVIKVKSPEGGRAALQSLIGRADVLIEAHSPGRRDVPGPAARDISFSNPGLIHLSITGFGKSGPKAGFRWSDAVLSAFGGQMYVVGPRSGPPRALPEGQPLYVSSLFGAVAVLLALRGRKLTGKGLHIDLSAQEAVVSTLDHVMADYFRDGTVCRREGGLYGNGSFALLPCADGYVLLTVLMNWEVLLDLMASEGKAEDLVEEKWRDPHYREAHIDHILSTVGRWTKSFTKSELFSLGQAMRLPWAPVCTPEEVLESPQLAARLFFNACEVGIDEGPAAFPGLPYKFRCFSPSRPEAAPQPGEHDRQFLKDLDGRQLKEEKGATARSDAGGVDAGRGVLRGIRVLDFTRMLAGPYATRILADFGAEVIKVEPIRAARETATIYDAAWNRNKRSITLDLDRQEGREIIMKLVAGTDVVVENFSPRVMANWGLTYDELSKVRPGLVMASISAMGQSGPWRDYVGFGPTFHALSGLVSETSRGLDAPVCPGHAYGDTIIGLYGALAILAALKRRDENGQGEYIDLSGYEALCTLLGPALLETARSKDGRGQAGGRKDSGSRRLLSLPGPGSMVGYHRPRGRRLAEVVHGSGLGRASG